MAPTVTRHRSTACVVSLLVCTLAACSPDAAFRRLVPADADARARGYLQLFTRHQIQAAEARLLPTLSVPEAHRAFIAIDSLLGGERLDSARLVGVSINRFSNGVRHVSLTYEARTRRGWTMENVATVDSAGAWYVEGMSARPIAQAFEVENAFSLGHRSVGQYLWFLMTIGCAILSLGSALWVATRRQMPKRWRWVLASIVGVGSYSMNWTTGQTAIRLVSVQLFSAAAVRSGPVAPWVITFAFPIGAIVALTRVARWRRDVAAEAASPVDAPA